MPRIRDMGVDVVWFMPIHPIGQLNKKGELGCPYPIQDYYEVNPEYGTRREFELLVQYAHALWQAENEGLYGVFTVSGVVDVQPMPLPDGEYVDVLSETAVSVRDGQMAVPDTAVILCFSGVMEDVGPRIWL